MMEQRASTASEIVLFEDSHLKADFGKSGCSCHATGTSTWLILSILDIRHTALDRPYQRLLQTFLQNSYS